MQKIWHSIFWKILSCGCFAAINVLVRFISGGSPKGIIGLPIYTIMFFQHLIGFIIISLWMVRCNEAHLKNFATERPWLHLWRVIIATLGIGLFYFSLRYIPVTQAVALSVTTPIFTTIGAVLFLKENFDWQRKIAVLLSVIGGVLIARPQSVLGQTTFSWYMLLPIIAALAFALDKLLTRKLLAHNEHPRTLAWYLLASIAPLSLLPAMYYGWVTPELQHWPWLLMLGFLGAAAHYTFNKAYALAEVTMLLPFGAARLILGAIFSFLAFQEIPKAFDMWLGVGTIFFSTIILSIDNNVFIKVRNKQFSKQGV